MGEGSKKKPRERVMSTMHHFESHPAYHLVQTRPQGILNNLEPNRLPVPPALNINAHSTPAGGSWLRRLFGRG
jgi:hypothetical protein